MGFQPARKAGNVVDDDDELILPVGPQKGQHVRHSGTADLAARGIVLEDADNVVTTIVCVFAAARLLGL